MGCSGLLVTATCAACDPPPHIPRHDAPVADAPLGNAPLGNAPACDARRSRIPSEVDVTVARQRKTSLVKSSHLKIGASATVPPPATADGQPNTLTASRTNALAATNGDAPTAPSLAPPRDAHLP